MRNTKEEFSKERIKAEMNEAKWNSIGCAFIGGIFFFLAIGYTWGTLSAGTAKEALGLLFILWIIALGLTYGAWKYDQRYHKWKSML